MKEVINIVRHLSSEPMYKVVAGAILLRHKQFLFYIWCYIDVPILVVRYAKFWKYSYRFHSLSMTLAIFLSAFFEVLQFSRVKILQHDKNMPPARKLHSLIARLMMWISMAQLTFGTVLGILYVSQGKAVRFKPIVRRVHGVLGFGIYSLAKFQIFTERQFIGFALVGQAPMAQFWMMLVISFLTIFVMEGTEFIYRYSKERNLRKFHERELQLTEIQKSIVLRLRAGEDFREVQADFCAKTILIFMNTIYDMEDFIHPGGSIFYKIHNYKEISRILLGLDHDIHTGVIHSHGEAAFKVLGFNVIGSKFDKHRGSIWNILNARNFSPVQLDCRFEIERGISNDQVLFLHNDLYITNMRSKGILWIGKFYYVEEEGKPKRVLCGVTCLTPEYKKYQLELISCFEGDNWAEGWKDRVKAKSDSSTMLALGNCFDQYQGQDVKSLNIKGPFGEGLGITNDFSGRYVIITKGNGHLPFLDIFDFLLKKIMYTKAEKEGKHGLTKLIYPHQKYSEILVGATFELYADLSKLEDLPCLEMFYKLIEMNKELDDSDQNFKCMIRVEDGVSGLTREDGIPLTGREFDRRFFEDELLLFGDGKEDPETFNRPVNRITVSTGDLDYKRSVQRWCEDLGFIGNKLTFY